MKDTKKMLSVAIPISLMQRLDEYVEESGINKSSVTILALKRYLESEDGRLFENDK